MSLSEKATESGNPGRPAPGASNRLPELVVAIAFVFLITLLMVGTVISYRSLSASHESRAQVARTHQVIDTLDSLLLDVVNAEAGRRGYSLTHREDLLEPYYEGVHQMERDLAAAKRQLADDPTQRQRLEKLETLLNQHLALMQQGVEATRGRASGEPLEQDLVLRDRELVKQIRLLIASMQQEEQRRLAVNQQTEDQQTRRTARITLASNCVLLVLLLVVGGVIFRAVSRPVQPGPTLAEDPAGKPWLGYAVALAGVAVAALLRWGLGMMVGQELPPYITFYVVIMFSALLGGTGAGLLATALAVAAVFLPQIGDLNLAQPADVVGLALFCGINVAASLVCGALRASRGRVVAEGRRAAATARELAQVVRLLDLANVMVRDPEDRIIRWNKGCQRLFGFAAEQAMGQISHDLLHTRFPAPMADLRATLLETGRWEGELVHTAADGREITVKSEWVLWRGFDDEPAKVLEANTDITERKRAEEALRDREAELREAQQIARLGSWSWTPKNDQVTWSEVTYQIFGLDPRSLPPNFPHGHQELYTPESLSRLQAAVDRSINAGVSYELDLELVQALGTGRWVTVRGQADRNEQGRVTRLHGTIQEITRQKQAEKALRASESQATARAEELSAFMEAVPAITFLAHDPECRRITGSRATRQFLRAPEGANLSKTAPEEELAASYRVIKDGRELEPEALPMQKAAATGREVRDLELTFVFNDGTSRDIFGTAVPLFNEAGRVRGAVAAFVDITERKQVEDALRLSESFYRQTLESIPGMVFTTRPDGYCDYQSQQWVEFTGIPMTEHLGAGWNQLLHPEDRDQALAAWRAAVEERAPYDLEYRVRRHDGAYRWFKVRGRPIRDAEGQIVRWFGVALNIEDLKRAEAVRQRQNQRLQILNEAAADLLSAYEPAAIVSSLHERIASYFEADAFMLYLADETGQNLRLHACGGLAPELEQRLAQLRFGRLVCGPREAARQPLVAAHIQQTDAPGQRFVKKLGFHSYLYYPLLIGDRLLGTLAFASRRREVFSPGDQEFFQTIARNVALAFERSRLDAELRRHASQMETLVQERTAKLREMLAELEHISYTITHDMRAPLRAMTAFGEMLLTDQCQSCMRPASRDYMRRIMNAAGRMDQLITDALSYTNIVRSELPLEPVAVAALLRGMLESYPDFHPPRADIRLIGELPPVLGNGAALTQVFSNLLSNAIKFVAPGVHPRVRIWAEPKPRVVRYWVQDNGIGISQEEQDRIFGMFSQLTKAQGGTGIGLAIVRKAVERMGGRAGVISQPDEGSRFWVELQKAPLAVEENSRASAALNHP